MLQAQFILKYINDLRGQATSSVSRCLSNSNRDGEIFPPPLAVSFTLEPVSHPECILLTTFSRQDVRHAHSPNECLL